MPAPVAPAQSQSDLHPVCDGFARPKGRDKRSGSVRLRVNPRPRFPPESDARSPPELTKKYATAKTPYQRVLADKRVPETVKTDLAGQYDQLNPAQIRRDLLGCRTSS